MNVPQFTISQKINGWIKLWIEGKKACPVSITSSKPEGKKDN